jgi:hypothetical protein
MGAVSMVVAFTAEAGEAAGMAGVGVAAAGVGGAQAGVEAGAAAVGIAAAGAGAVVGAGVGIRAGRLRRRPCLSGSRSLHSQPMAAIRVVGSGGVSGQRTATIWAGGW